MQGFMREREAFPTQLDRQAAKSQDEPWNREAMSNPSPFDTQRGLGVSEPDLQTEIFLALVPLIVSESCQYTPDTPVRQK